MAHCRIAFLLAWVLAGAGVAQTGPTLPADELSPSLFPTEMPLGLPRTLPAPDDNPFTEASFALGRRLFFDPILSTDRTVACASCHQPGHGFASPQARPPGVKGRHALRNAPTLLNRGYGKHQRWDGLADSLEAQVLLPIEDPNEMDLSLAEATERLRQSESYRTAFKAAYGEAPSEQTLSRALSTFVRGLVLGNSPVDRFQSGGGGALNAAEKAGLWLYESKGRCWQCHSGANFTDEGFHNTGVGVSRDENGKPTPADGRFAVTNDPADRGKFKTPTLRAIADTGPYMHDGSLATLEEVVEFYARGGNQNPHLDSKLRPVELSATERANLVAFLRALSRQAR